MFQRKKKEDKQPKEVPQTQIVEEIDEVPEEQPKEQQPEEQPEEVELNEEIVREYFNNIAKVLNDLTLRIGRIEHNLRLDF